MVLFLGFQLDFDLQSQFAPSSTSININQKSSLFSIKCLQQVLMKLFQMQTSLLFCGLSGNKFQIFGQLFTFIILFTSLILPMNHLSAREMLSSLINHPKNPTPMKPPRSEKPAGRESHLSVRPDTREIGRRKYYQQRIKPAQPLEEQLDLEMGLELGHHAQTTKVIELAPQPHRYSHKLIPNRQSNVLTRLDESRNSENRLIRNRLDYSQLRTARGMTYDSLKEDSVQKGNNTSRNRSYLVKKVSKSHQGESLASSMLSNKILELQLKELDYYIPDVKESVLQFTHNPKFTSPHLEHFLDTITTFQMLVNVFVPRQPAKPVTLSGDPQGKITLLFDLDQTLVHSQVMNWNTEEKDMGWGKVVDVTTDLGDYRINLKIRPHAREVLKRLKEKFELGIFTASQQYYGNAILSELDPEGDLFSFKLFRNHCHELLNHCVHVKDLRVLKNRDISHMLLVDNSPHTYLFQKDNGIPIIPFSDDPKDTQMLKLETFLMKLNESKDVRRTLKEYFKFDQYHRFNNMMRLVKELYH